MTDTLAQVRAAYDRAPEHEWYRLVGGAQARLEYLITTHALQQHLPAPHPACRRYTDFLMRCVYAQPYAVLLAMLFGVEVSYFAAWSALPRSGPYTEFIERWSSADFAGYVAALGALAFQNPHEAAQEHFNEVLAHERDFWKMAWEG